MEVFWRVLPTNYPPPKWDHGGTALDRAKGNEGNWILVWEDGFCDFYECERAGSGCMKGRFGPQVFFKMSHKASWEVATDNSHKWVYRPTPNENDSGFISSWNMSIEPQPKAWESQFCSGIQIAEDLNLVISVQRNSSTCKAYREYSQYKDLTCHSNMHPFKPNTQLKIESQELAFSADDKNQITGAKRSFDKRFDNPPIKSMNSGWNSPRSGIPGPPIWSIPPLLPNISCSLGAFLSKLRSNFPSYGKSDVALVNGNQNNRVSQHVKADNNWGVPSQDEAADMKFELKSSWQLHRTKGGQPSSAISSLELKDEGGGFGPM